LVKTPSNTAGDDLRVIAEIGGNHNGDLGLAQRMVDAAADAGVWAVKFQTYKPGELVDPSSEYYEIFAGEALSFEEFADLAQYCRARGVEFMSTPFGQESADLLASLEVPAFKVASGDLTHLSFLRYVAAKGRPVLLSTGASEWADIDRAVEVLRAAGCDYVLLHCTAAYPAVDEEINLRVLPELKRRYGCPVGFSDHSLGVDLALAAIALGASVVEKHFTIDRELPGGDNDMSITPDEMQALVEGGRRIVTALGDSERKLTLAEHRLQPIMRRSLVATRAMEAGSVLGRCDVHIVRPGTGIEPAALDEVVGRTLAVAVVAGQVLNWDMVVERIGE
jgi:N,N'-diacetyllegionaminate synthase